MKYYNNYDFLNAIIHYGELEYDEIVKLNDGKPLVINGKEVKSILNDDGLKFSYIADNGIEYSKSLNINDIQEKVRNKIYKFLCDNWNDNYDFFNGL